IAAVLFTIAALAPAAPAQTCGWRAMGIPDLTPGVRGQVYALTPFAGGNGLAPGLYATGGFDITSPSGQRMRFLTRYDAGGWSPVNNDWFFYSMVAMTDSRGPALFGASVYQVYRITGAGVEALPGTFNGGPVSTLAALAIDGVESLYAGGYFNDVDGVPCP